MKFKKQTKKQIKYWTILILFTVFAAAAIKLAGSARSVEADTYIEPAKKEKVIQEKDLTVEEYVFSEFRKAGLSAKEVECVICNESGWDVYAINKNNNGTFDLGLFQINDIHNVSREISFNYKEATKWAIQKRLHDGNWCAWYGARKCGLCK